MKKALLCGMVIWMSAGTMWGDDAQQALKTVAKTAAGALCVVEYKTSIGGTETPHDGIGVCIDPSGLFMTTAIPAQTPLDEIQDIQVIPPGAEAKPIPAKLQGMDTFTGLAFLRCEASHNWTAVEFLKSANLSLGDRVLSAGLNTSLPDNALTLGMAYVGSEQHVPDRLIRVTGGTLSMAGSVVFNEQGKGIGLITSRQPYMPFQVYSRQRPQTLMMYQTETTVSFTPVDEFAKILMNIPSGGAVQRPGWIGGFLVPVPELLRDAKKLTGTAVMLDRVLPGSSAEKAGLKNRDIVVGIDGQPLPSLGNDMLTARSIQQTLARKKTGETVSLTIQDAAGPRSVSVTIEPMPLTGNEAPRYLNKEVGLALREKVPFDEAGDDPNAKKPGLIVIAILKDSPAGKTDLRKDDLVTSIDGKSTLSIDAAKKAVENCLAQEPPKDISITVQKGELSETYTIKAP